MANMKDALGKYIFEYVLDLEKNIESNLNELSKNNEEWAVEVDYSFSFSPNRKIRDHFLVTIIPYINDIKQGTYKFKFQSVETISLKEVCKVMYNIILNPEKSNGIIENSIVSIEYLV